jgi:hypothetical protein
LVNAAHRYNAATKHTVNRGGAQLILQPRARCHRWTIALLGGFAATTVLGGCNSALESASATKQSPPAFVAEFPASAPQAPATQPATTAYSDPHADKRPAVVEDKSPVVATVSRKFGPPPLELVGTTISDTNTFAVIKEADSNVRTVRQGDSLDGYTIGAIATDHVTVTSPDNAKHVLALSAASEVSTASTPTVSETSEPVPNPALITEGVNTDQSAPQNGTSVPTAELPEGMKQIGH